MCSILCAKPCSKGWSASPQVWEMWVLLWAGAGTACRMQCWSTEGHTARGWGILVKGVCV